MKPRERALHALSLEEPDRIPMFELVFRYPEEIVGECYISDFPSPSTKKGLDLVKHNTRVLAETYVKMGYDILPYIGFFTGQTRAIRMLKKLAPDHLIAGSAGGTLGIPHGNNMATIVNQVFSKSAKIRKKLDKDIKANIESIKEQADAGAEVIIDCTDYCLKEGPFYPLWVYKELVLPYLKKLVDAAHKKNIFFIKHTDGNLSLIIDELVATGIDALHSIDPSANMKLEEIKSRYGDRLAICGNVDAATTMVSGTPEQVAEEARQCIKTAAAGGGYFLTTSNCIYKGVPLNNAITLAAFGKKYGRYPIC